MEGSREAAGNKCAALAGARRHGWTGAAWACAVLACSSSDESANPASTGARSGPAESVYDRERRIEVRIELAPEDWERLRYDGRSAAQLFGGAPRDYRYPEYFGSVTVDGVRYERVEIRKKGFIGSLSSLRPSLRLDFEADGADLDGGLRRFTLNAGVQDRSRARECMAYDMFSAAGVPASRCGFAHVVVNSEDLGTYTNVEPVRGPMLRRYWPDTTGALYEGTLADFDAESWQDLELDSNAPTDHAEAQRLVAVLEEGDETLVESLGEVVDIDKFRDFWALETLIGHWDGYAETANNYYAFFNRQSGRFEFIPWGLDQSFTGTRPFDMAPYEITVYARSKLARRLYDVPEQRELFRQRLGELNDQLWDEATLLAQADAIERLVPDANADAMAEHREFLGTHGEALRGALRQPAPEIVDRVEPAPPDCPTPPGPLQGSFSTSWEAEGGSAELALSLDGAPISAPPFFPSAATDANSGEAVLSFFGPLEDGRSLLLSIILPRARMKPGVHPFHGSEIFGVLGVLSPTSEYTLLGLVGDGELRLDKAGTAAAAPVAGSFEATTYQSACFGPGGG